MKVNVTEGDVNWALTLIGTFTLIYTYAILSKRIQGSKLYKSAEQFKKRNFP